MGIFGNILNKIFHHDAAAQPAPQVQQTQVAPPLSPSLSTPPATIDVGAVLETMAGGKDDKGGNYRSSIVDLLKVLDLDSSLGARKELGEELGVHAGADGTAEQNIALHRAVMDKLAANGGLVPDSLRS